MKAKILQFPPRAKPALPDLPPPRRERPGALGFVLSVDTADLARELIKQMTDDEDWEGSDD